MSQMTQVTIDAMYGEQADLENQLAAVINNVPRDVVEQQKVEALIQDKKTEIQAAEKELREQDTVIKAQEVNGTNSDIAIAILDAAIPSESAIPSKVGLTEYGIFRTDLLQMIDGALTDRTTTLQQRYAEEMVQRDEKIRLVQNQTNEVRQQLDEQIRLNKIFAARNTELLGELSTSETASEEITNMLNITKNQLNDAQSDIQKYKATIAENESLKQQIAELEQNLKAAQQPKTESQPSQSFTDRMNEIKSKNEARIKSNLELAAEGALGYRGKVEVPSVPQQELPFQATAAGSTSNQLPTTETSAPVEGNQFPVTPPTIVQSPEVPSTSKELVVEPSSSEGQGGEAKVTASQLEERLTQFAAEHGLVKGQVA